MSKILLIAWMLTGAGLASGQSVKTDSLKRLLAQLPPVGRSWATDTLRIRVLYELGWGEPNAQAALRHLNQALQLAQQQHWQRGEMWATAYLGCRVGRMGSDYRACEYLFQSLYLAEAVHDEDCTGFSLRFLGDNHRDLGDWGKGRQFYLEALPHLAKARNWRLYLITINNIGEGYLQQGDYEKAIKYLSQCLAKNKQFQIKEINAFCLINLASCYEKKGDLKRALGLMQQFKALNHTDVDDLAEAEAQISRILLAMGDYAGALRYASQADKRVDKKRSTTLKDIHNTLYTIYLKQGNYQAALAHYHQLMELKDINTNDMQHRQIDALRVRYENEKQRADIRLLNTERQVLIGGLILFLLFAGLLIWNNRLLNQKNREIETQRNLINLAKERLAESNLLLTDLNNTLEDKVRLRTEDLTLANEELIRKNREIKDAFFNGQSLERKRVASELHDNLGSTLSGLKWQLESLDTNTFTPKERQVYQRVLTLMGSAYADVRNISHNLMPAELEANGLSAALQKLVDDLNQNGRTRFSFVSTYIAGSLQKKAEMELYSISLELINNILKHAQATEASIELDFMEESDQLLLSFIDNGIGLPEHFFLVGEGMGLKNLQNRITGLNGHIDVIAVVPQGTAFTLLISTAYNS